MCIELHFLLFDLCPANGVVLWRRVMAVRNPAARPYFPNQYLPPVGYAPHSVLRETGVLIITRIAILAADQNFDAIRLAWTCG